MKEISPEEIRAIRKQQSLLDSTWSADRENTMIEAGVRAQLDSCEKEAMEMIEVLEEAFGDFLIVKVVWQVVKERLLK